MKGDTAERRAIRKVPAIRNALQEAAKPLIERFQGYVKGQRLSAEHREAVVSLLALYDGLCTRVVEVTGLSLGVVWEIKHANMGAFAEKREAWKKAAAVESQEVFQVATEVVRMKAEELSPYQAALVAGIYADKSLALAGDAVATVRHEIVDHRSLDEIADRLRALQPIQVVGEAEFTVKNE